MTSSLATWLAGHSAADLARLLERRPEVTAAPHPRDLVELAYRLESPYGVSAAFQRLPLPCVQLIEVLLGFGGPTRDELVALLCGGASGTGGGDPAGAATGVDEHLATLARLALVWPDGARLGIAAPLREGIEYPLSLGGTAATLLARATVAELRPLALAVGVTGAAKAPRRADLFAALLDWYADPARVRKVCDTAPPAVRRVLDETAWHGPHLETPAIYYSGPATHGGPLGWATQRGLMVQRTWQSAEMPREVAIALRGPDWRPPFDPTPPHLPTVAVDPLALRREAAASASAAVDQVAALLHECSKAPVALLKAGGVGAREQRRLARALGLTGPDEPVVRLWLELAGRAGLVTQEDGTLLVTPAADEWLADEPAGRLVALLRAWARLPAVPLLGKDADGNAPPAPLGTVVGGPVLIRLRHSVLAALAVLAPERGAADPAALTAVLEWREPVLLVALDEVGDVVEPVLREAGLLGVVCRGALTVFGRALANDDEPALRAATADLLDAPTGTAIFQTDLTVVVPGSPGTALATLLDAAAQREARGAASTWRFSAVSVRRALDAGHVAAELTEALAAVAANGELPQALRYLIADVDRRHGQVRVRPAGCVLRGEDPALLTEIAATKSLRALGLSVVAPTVLVSPLPVADTLAALRAAGYAPVAEDGTGAAVLERVPQRRAALPAPRGGTPERGRRGSPARDAGSRDSGSRDSGSRDTVRLPAPAGPADPLALATMLLAAPPRAHSARPDQDDNPTRAMVAASARVLNPAEQELLAFAIDGGYPVRIGYINAAGNHSSRVIEPEALEGEALVAWCRLREDGRVFRLSRITSVAPA